MKAFSKSFLLLLSWAVSLGLTVAIIGSITLLLLFEYFSKDLPDYRQLADYEPAIVTRLYAADGKLLAEYAKEQRIFVPFSVVPKHVVNAFIAAEDKNFYTHKGVDFSGIARAIRDNIINYGQGKSLVGGSTITQQVVKNFLLSNEKSIERKIKEAILATRISNVYSKDKILELYLNEIYLGMGSYGVAAAAQNYFNKSLDELNIAEAALLATQPKAPSLYNPKKRYEATLARRNWVIDRMHDSGFITPEETKKAKGTPIILGKRDKAEIVKAGFFAEEVRKLLSNMYGSNILYEGGLVVKTTLDPVLQKYAQDALHKTLTAYDRRHGYRGPLAHLPAIGAKAHDWQERMKDFSNKYHPYLFDGQKIAMVTGTDAKKAQIIFVDESDGIVPLSLLKWTRRMDMKGRLGPKIRKISDIIHVGDVLLVGPTSREQKKLLSSKDKKIAWDLRQIPEVNGALVALDPHTGRLLAMSGGYSFAGTEFNRATQAKRQPGSAFKPFVYIAGLENGFTPSTIIDDSPIEISQGEGRPNWKPQNYGGDFLGTVTMRFGLEKSRNVMTVRLAQMIGIQKILEIGKRFGIYKKPPRNFSIVLGSSETTLLKLVNAYAMLVNGGKKITPSLLERIDDKHGKTIYRRDSRECPECNISNIEDIASYKNPPLLVDNRKQLVDPRLAYQMVSMLQGAASRGTGVRSREIGKIVAGKTGTTNNSFDAWFIGFSPDLVVGVYVGYDKPRSLGRKETGASVALPAFTEFMKKALAKESNKPFRIPRGIQLVRVDSATGLPPTGEELEPVELIEETYITGGPLFIPGRNQLQELPDYTAITDPYGQRLNKREIGMDNNGINRLEDRGYPMPPTMEKSTLPVVGTGALY